MSYSNYFRAMAQMTAAQGAFDRRDEDPAYSDPREVRDEEEDE